MIPLPSDVKENILGWLPHVLAGYDYPMIETDNIVPDLTAPAITYYFSSAGTPSQYSNTILRTVRNYDDGTLDDWWGEYYFCTMNVVLRANTNTELSAMWEDFLRKCPATRRDLVLQIDRVRFIEILNSIPLEPQRLDGGKNLFWAQVDLRFEYEVSDISDAEIIKTVYTDLNRHGDTHDSHLYFEFNAPTLVTANFDVIAAIQVQRTLTVGTSAYIVAN